MKKQSRASHHLPFYGNDFFQALEGYPDTLIVSYLRALWHYWHHFHCEGLPDDDEYLLRVCRCEKATWARTKGVLFDNDRFFKLESGKWHQTRCRCEHDRALEIYSAKVSALTKARSKNPNNSTITSTMHSTAHSAILPTLNEHKPEPEPEPVLEGRKEGGHPSLEEVKAAASRSGMLERDAIAFWNHFESSGWIDKNRNPIIKWGPKMANWRASAAAAPLEANHRASESVSTASNVILWQTELKRVEQKISDIRANATRMAMGIEFTEVEVFNLKSLRERVTELKGKLGFQA